MFSELTCYVCGCVCVPEDVEGRSCPDCSAGGPRSSKAVFRDPPQTSILSAPGPETEAEAGAGGGHTVRSTQCK